jgi:hypothetical protein
MPLGGQLAHEGDIGTLQDLGVIRDSHGGEWDEWPADLRVRECPETYARERVAYANAR